MKVKLVVCAALLFGLVVRLGAQTKPTVETFKQVMTKRLMKLVIDGYPQRDVRFIAVQAGTPRDGSYPFRATIVIRDYGPGYPKNRYYGSTCVGKLVEQDYYMVADDFGGWKVEGVMTPTKTCKDNPAEGVSSFPVDSLEGTPADMRAPATPATATPASAPPARTGSLTTGEWACYGSGGRALIGLGFKVQADGSYTDLDNRSRGTYVLAGSTITFKGGHLDGQVAHAVGGGKYNIGTTTCEPNR